MLVFEKIEKVQFGDLVVEPKLNKETTMRLRNLEITDSKLDEAREVISECFGVYASEVKAFMEENMFKSDLARLQVYLSQGAAALDKYDESVSRALEKHLDEAMAKGSDGNS